MKMKYKLLLIHLAFVLVSKAQVFIPKEHYIKKEIYIEMRDGVKLFTAIYSPKDTTQKYPILLNRTPYGIGPYGEDKFPGQLRPSEAFAKEGYIFVFQDVRGKNLSQGEFINMTPHKAEKKSIKDIDESTDTYDCIEWLLKHIKNHNGKVGQWGISYPGFYTSAGMIDAHPALKAASPQAPICDWFTGDDFHHNGVFFLPHFFGFTYSFGQIRKELKPANWRSFPYPTPDGYRFYLDYVGPLKNVSKLYNNEIPFWNDVIQHEAYDTFWQTRNLRPHLKNIKPAVMVVGGWFDAENLYGALQTYYTIEKQSPKTTNGIVMGPWVHGGWNRSNGDYLGDISFKQKTAQYYRDSIEFPFFNYYLKGKGKYKPTEAIMFETGSNQWKVYAQWPPKKAVKQSYYLHSNGQLTAGMDDGAQSFLSDPNKPVPYMQTCDNGMSREYMVADQRFAATRPDVMVYQTESFNDETIFTGPIEVELVVSTTNTDADWVVKIIDVYPDSAGSDSVNGRSIKMSGYQMLVRGDIMRGKFRKSFSSPIPFEPGKKDTVSFTISDINHCFKKGHRLMIQVQSTWFPLAERNPQQFMNVFEAEEKDFIKATHTIFGSSKVTFYKLEQR
jgi:putative CocE/NonD family hydrolase